MNSILRLAFFLIAFPFIGTSQCYITITPMDTTVCPGDTVQINAYAALLGAGQTFDFNTGLLPPGWGTSGGTAYSTPCGNNPTGTPYFWASTTTSNPNISTAAFDVSCGGFIIFDMVYAIQGGATPCEGPDLIGEGVELQYSTDNGLTWIPIIYYNPNGTVQASQSAATGTGISGPTIYTTWENYTVPIPPGGVTTSTMFRWFQWSTSGTCCDNWGLDNIVINATGPPCGATAVVNWSNGLMDTTSFYVVPYADTFFIASVYDTAGNFQCISDTVFINIPTNNLTYNLDDTVYAYCPDATTLVEVTNILNGVPPITIEWSTGNIGNPEILPASGTPHDTIEYTVTITDACNYTYYDTVNLVVNQLLTIDDLDSVDAASCVNNGMVTATVSGITSVLGQPVYYWNGPGASNPNFINATVWPNLGSGWYYFEVTDDVCTTNDSIYVNLLDPPIADFSASTTSGCDPVNVTLSNNSANSTSYVWIIGNDTITTNSLGNQSGSFSESSMVILTASDDAGCTNSMTVDISVIICGCMDPLATNYNPLAVSDDGNCFYPTPTVITPNVFTPNNDGDNDVYELEVTNASNIELTITNRWGNLMYYGTGLDPAWNGISPGGNIAEEGVYFYQYVITSINGAETIDGHGFLHLARD